MKDKFYKYIIKTDSGYQIKKGNEKFGTYSKLSDALYERDRLVKVDWDWDDLMALEETHNFYEDMVLPPFHHKMSHIHKCPLVYEVWVNKTYRGRFNNKSDATAFAKEIGGAIRPKKPRYRVQKSIDGKMKYFGQYRTLNEAIRRRNELEENGWVKDDKSVE